MHHVRFLYAQIVGNNYPRGYDGGNEKADRKEGADWHFKILNARS